MSTSANANTFPKRPRFAWDEKCPPWTDGKGNQDKFKAAVEDWKEFNNALPASSPNKVPTTLQGIVLK